MRTKATACRRPTFRIARIAAPIPDAGSSGLPKKLIEGGRRSGLKHLDACDERAEVEDLLGPRAGRCPHRDEPEIERHLLVAALEQGRVRVGARVDQPRDDDEPPAVDLALEGALAMGAVESGRA